MNQIKFVLAAIVFALFAQVSHAQSFPSGAHAHGWGSGWFPQILDHSQPASSGKFRQRYFYNSEFAKGPNAPVLLLICGEGPCDEFSLSHSLKFDPNVIAQFAKELGAHMVALEHRYYGQSQPFPNLSTPNLRFLTVENALADLATFEDSIKTQLGWAGPWISIGGSYSGALSAWYRLYYPNEVVGALASSAPVHITENFWQYDVAITRGLGPACLAKVRDLVREFEPMVTDPAQAARFRTMFKGELINDPRDLLGTVEDIGSGAVQYNMVDELCGPLTTSSDPMGAYLQIFQKFFGKTSCDVYQNSFQSLIDDGVASHVCPVSPTKTSQRQWFYQTCTQMGYFQTAAPPPVSMRSQYMTLGLYREYCQKAFGITRPIDEQGFNRRYYEPLRHGGISNVLFTNGSQDPWSMLSFSANSGVAQSPALSAFQIQGAAHCADISSHPGPANPASLLAARQLFLRLAHQWIQGH